MSLDDDGWSRKRPAAAFEKQTQKLYENESHSHATTSTINDASDTQSLADSSKKSPLNLSIPRNMIHHHLMDFHEP
jgi:hypothetical protein